MKIESYHLLILLLCLFGCSPISKIPSDELKLKPNEVMFIKLSINYLIANDIRFDGLSIDSFYICNKFDIFSKKRVPEELEKNLTFDSKTEQILNDKFFHKFNSELEKWSKNKKYGRRLSVSGFNEEWIMITYSEFGDRESDICDEMPSSFYTYVLKKEEDNFSIKVGTSVHFN